MTVDFDEWRDRTVFSGTQLGKAQARAAYESATLAERARCAKLCEWQPIETAPKDKPLLLLNGEDVGIGFAAEDGDPEYASMWMPLPSTPQEK